MELQNKGHYHSNGLLFNSCRNALRYYVKKKKIKEIYLPDYTCPSVWTAVLAEGCIIKPYEVDDDFRPIYDFMEDDWVLYTNYLGLCDNIADDLSLFLNNMIFDCAQSFFSHNKGIATIYSPRKFFGVPDGGILISDLETNTELNKCYSYDKCEHLLKRIECPPNEAYNSYCGNEIAIGESSIQIMSGITEKILKSIDYDQVIKKRKENYAYLDKKLSGYTEKKILIGNDSVPLAYPFFNGDYELRKKLIKKGVYVAKYWNKDDNVKCLSLSKSIKMADMLIPLPIDQRYSKEEMDYIADVVIDEL